MSERLVLALDGATRVSTAALLRPKVLASPFEGPGSLWEVMATRAHHDGRAQGRVLLSDVDEMLHDVGARPADIGAIVAGTGPGTFTGVRIAVATARALSVSLGVPVTGVSTLAALAAGTALHAEARHLVPAVDARRGQVFFAVYKAASVLEMKRWVRATPIGVCDRGALGAILESVEGPALVVAEERAVVGELPEGVEFAAGTVAAEHLVLGQGLLREPGEAPEGLRLLPWLIEALVAGGPVEPEKVKPIYVRSPDADLHITKMKDPWAEEAAGRSKCGES